MHYPLTMGYTSINPYTLLKKEHIQHVKDYITPIEGNTLKPNQTNIIRHGKSIN